MKTQVFFLDYDLSGPNATVKGQRVHYCKVEVTICKHGYLISVYKIKNGWRIYEIFLVSSIGDLHEYLPKGIDWILSYQTEQYKLILFCYKI